MTTGTTTPFLYVYDRFLSKITDDLYLELTEEDTHADLQSIILNAIPGFEFPRVPIFNYQLIEHITADGVTAIGYFDCELSREEIDIVSDLMMIEWLNRQILSVENTRMKYSGSDFKFTSQANHLDKLVKAKDNFLLSNRHKQRLYKRRKINSSSGMIESNWGGLAGGASLNGN